MHGIQGGFTKRKCGRSSHGRMSFRREIVNFLGYTISAGEFSARKKSPAANANKAPTTGD
jgi:hypothetical protein